MHPMTLYDAALQQHARQERDRDRSFLVALRRRDRAAEARPAPTAPQRLRRDDLALAR